MAAPQTIETGTLSVASALPDPPFEVVTKGVVTGYDADLLQAVCAPWRSRKRRQGRASTGTTRRTASM